MRTLTEGCSNRCAGCQLRHNEEDEVADDDVDVRETMRRLPWWMQGFLTWLTGVPLQGQRWPMKPTPYLYLASNIAKAAAGVALTMFAMHASPLWWPIVIFGWVLTVSGARVLQVTILHHAVHVNVSGNEKLDRFIGEAISIALLIQDYASYFYDHVVVHHGKKLATLDDPDLKFLWLLFFRPGKTVQQLWGQLWWTLVSPRFHYLFLRARLLANFGHPQRSRRVITVVYHAVVISTVAATGLWMEWLVAWVLPITVLYQMSALLQFVCEHFWLRVKDPNTPAKVVYARLSLTRCMGEAAPASTGASWQDAKAWGRWWLRMLGLHLPCRLFVIVGDLPVHDWHHRHPKDANWTIGAYARRADQEAGYPGWEEPYTEVWGLGEAITEVFEVISQAPSLPDRDLTIKQMSKTEIADVLNGM